MSEFSHYDNNADSKMVDVSHKPITIRTAKAKGFVRMDRSTVEKIKNNLIPKGNPFEVARIAGILAAKNTASLIPMCHPLILSFVDVAIEIKNDLSGVDIHSEIRLEGKTGAEMEALTAVTVAALTIYDMCKAVDKNMVIEDVVLIEKKGGKLEF